MTAGCSSPASGFHSLWWFTRIRKTCFTRTQSVWVCANYQSLEKCGLFVSTRRCLQLHIPPALTLFRRMVANTLSGRMFGFFPWKVKESKVQVDKEPEGQRGSAPQPNQCRAARLNQGKGYSTVQTIGGENCQTKSNTKQKKRNHIALWHRLKKIKTPSGNKSSSNVTVTLHLCCTVKIKSSFFSQILIIFWQLLDKTAVSQPNLA